MIVDHRGHERTTRPQRYYKSDHWRKQIYNKCVDCMKPTSHKPWDNEERSKRCAKCYLQFCHLEAEEIHAKRNSILQQNMSELSQPIPNTRPEGSDVLGQM